MLDRFSRIFRREGLRGFYVRLRYPKRRARGGSEMPATRPPFRITGGTAAQAERLRQALGLVLESSAVTGTGVDAAGQNTIRLSPAITDPAPGRNCTVLWHSPQEVGAFCRDTVQARRWLAKAAAILVPSAECFQRLVGLGLVERKILVMPLADDADPQTLAGALARWLIETRALSPRDMDTALFPVLAGLEPGAKLCLGLPESSRRRLSFLAHGLSDFRMFDGIRLSPGWIGCGWSYRTIARAALARGALPILVCEDDMAPSPGFRRNLERVEEYLAGQDWDLFSGLLTDLSETVRIDHVVRQDGLTFVHLNYATGMVMNIYGPRVLAHLANWNPETGPIETNTIDAWMSELPGLRVVTTLPFLVGHDSQVRSTLFGFANRRYEGMIRASEARLERMVEAFEAGARRHKRADDPR